MDSTAERSKEAFLDKVKDELRGILKRAKKAGHTLESIQDVTFERLAERFGISVEHVNELKTKVWREIS